jgi:hypothetical protein
VTRRHQAAEAGKQTTATLAREQHEEVCGAGPDGQAAEDCNQEADVQRTAPGMRLHVHRVSIGLAILLLASIQLAWLALLGYGLVQLFS